MKLFNLIKLYICIYFRVNFLKLNILPFFFEKLNVFSIKKYNKVLKQKIFIYIFIKLLKKIIGKKYCYYL